VNQQLLKEYVKYDPNIGEFVQIKKTHPRDNTRKVGGTLGYEDGRGYIHFSLLGKKYKSHILAWLYIYGKMPENLIDHIDGDRRNNKINNLRLATNSQNQQNRRRFNSLSGFKGVYPKRNSRGEINKWMAQYNKIFLGYFKCKIEAAKSYDIYIRSVGGDYAATNEEIVGYGTLGD